MSPAEIISWIQFAALVLKYGKEVVDGAVEIYERVAAAFRHKSDAGAEKAAAFNSDFVAVVKASPTITGKTEQKALANVDAIREGVWKTRPENLGKKPKPILGQKPGSGGTH